MIAAAVQLITVARALSAKTWLIAFAVIAMLTAAARLVSYGEHRAALRVATLARADTIKGDVAALTGAQREEDTALARLAAARTATVTTERARKHARSVVFPGATKNASVAPIDSLPIAVITLLTADDARITADSIYIAAAESLMKAIKVVAIAHAALDTTLMHLLYVPTEGASVLPGRRYAIAGILGIGARLGYNLVRRRQLLP